MIQAICGPMFSGKSEELIRRLVRAEIAGRHVNAIRPEVDTRSYTGHTDISSLSGSKFPAVSIEDPLEIEFAAENADVLGIDETQFFQAGALPSILSASRNCTVILSGLDMTYRQEPFGIMPYLLAVADSVTKLSAVCHSCGSDAIYTQRLIDGEPASFSGPTVQIGSQDSYEARCRNCFRFLP